MELPPAVLAGQISAWQTPPSLPPLRLRCALLSHIPHPDSALLGNIDITGNAGQHHGLQQPQAYIPCSPSPWYLGNECGDSRRPSEKSILRVAVSRSPKPTDWNGLRGRNGLGLSGSEKFKKVCTGRCEMWATGDGRGENRAQALSPRPGGGSSGAPRCGGCGRGCGCARGHTGSGIGRVGRARVHRLSWRHCSPTSHTRSRWSRLPRPDQPPTGQQLIFRPGEPDPRIPALPGSRIPPRCLLCGMRWPHILRTQR